MAGNPYINLVNGRLTQVLANQTSAGTADAGKLIALNPSGQLDNSMLPTGVGADVVSITASEALSAGAFVNIYSNAGTPNARNADNTAQGKEACGFVLAAVASAATASVYLQGQNNQLTSLTPGAMYYLGTAGAATSTPPTASGAVVQPLGIADTATVINFSKQPDVTLA